MDHRLVFDTELRGQLDRLVDRHLRAEDQGDVETILADMTDDVEHDVLGAPENPLCGKAVLRDHYRDRFANAVFEREVPLRRLHGAGFVVDERIWEGRITGRVGSGVGRGRRVSHRQLHILELHDGRIARHSVYLDSDALMHQLS